MASTEITNQFIVMHETERLKPVFTIPCTSVCRAGLERPVALIWPAGHCLSRSGLNCDSKALCCSTLVRYEISSGVFKKISHLSESHYFSVSFSEVTGKTIQHSSTRRRQMALKTDSELLKEI